MAAVVLWTILALAALDLAVGLAARDPGGPDARLNGLQRYFGYGASVEAKLRAELGAAPGREAAIVRAGWLGHECDAPRLADDPRGVSVYGMSFSHRVADQLRLLDPALRVHSFVGPGAPPSHSYACMLRRQRAEIDGDGVQVIGVLASALIRMRSTSGLVNTFEQPQPFTFPHYALAGGRLVATAPAIDDVAGLRRVLASQAAWRGYVEGLTRQDGLTAPSLMLGGMLDHSMTVRLLRRAWAQRRTREAASSAPNAHRSTSIKRNEDVTP